MHLELIWMNGFSHKKITTTQTWDKAPCFSPIVQGVSLVLTLLTIRENFNQAKDYLWNQAFVNLLHYLLFGSIGFGHI